jgi:hypothetical protein
MKVLINKLQDIEPNEFWYLASPYSKYPDGIEAAFKEVSKGAAWLISKGVKLYCPIAHTHPIAIHGGMNPLDHEIWLPADTPFMNTAMGLLVYQMPTWQDSYGISVEIEMFKQQEKPVEYLEWPLEIV